MRAKELITEEIPPLTHTDSGEKALRWMDEFKVSHLPVLKNGNFVGVISESDVLDKMDIVESLDKLFDHLPRPYVFENAHIYEVLSKISEHRISILPILDENEKYLGCTSVYHLLTVIANTGSIKETGGIIVLEVNSIDYSMAQIAQIVESNNGKLLGLFVSSSDVETIEVTLKINIGPINEIIQTFRRYDYEIISEHHEDNYINTLKERSDYLDKYLNI